MLRFGDDSIICDVIKWLEWNWEGNKFGGNKWRKWKIPTCPFVVRIQTEIQIQTAALRYTSVFMFVYRVTMEDIITRYGCRKDSTGTQTQKKVITASSYEAE